MMQELAWFVGVDWGSQRHAVCLLDATGQVVERWAEANTGAGLRHLVIRLEQLTARHLERVGVGIELPEGALVETLAAAGVAVYSLNPKQLDRFRDRHRPAGSKDDRLDALVLADSLRTDRQAFHRVALLPAEVLQLRGLLRAEEELKVDFRRDANRLQALLLSYFPALLELAPAADEPWLWELLARAPLPAAARRLQERTLAQILKSHRIRRLSAAQLRALLHQEPFYRAPGAAEAASERVLLLLPRLMMAHEQLDRVQRRVQALLEERRLPVEGRRPADEPERCEHRDAEILLSMPGVGRFVAATMLAEAHEALAAREYHALRLRAGLAPVTIASGKSRRVRMRRAHDPRLANACYHMARVAIQHDSGAQGHYQALRQRGQRHGAALRAVADRLLRILCAMLRDGTIYDPLRPRRAASPPALAA